MITGCLIDVKLIKKYSKKKPGGIPAL